jgi:putative DNA primase/helicase
MVEEKYSMGTSNEGPQSLTARGARAEDAGRPADAARASAGWEQEGTRADRVSQLPTELKSPPRWVVWRWQTSPGGKPTKVPYSPRTERLASTTDPGTWGTFEEAKVADETMPGAGGIGFVFNGDGIVGVDLDNCIDAGGRVAPWAQAIISDLDSYAEISPSGRGVHVLLRGVLPPGGRRKRYISAGPGEDGRRSAIEMYDRSRYFAMTGQRMPDAAGTIEEREAELHAVYAEYLADSAASNGRGATHGTVLADDEPMEGISDAELIEKAGHAENGEKFQRLWRGDSGGYGSRSEGDLALCLILHFWTRGDAGRMDRLFRQSGRMRPKWDEKHFAGGRTYGQATITKAIELGREIYTGGCRAGYANGASGVAGAGPARGDEPKVSRMGASFPTTDMGNAQRLVGLHGKDIRYCHSWRSWFVWDGRRWAVDITGEVMRRAKETVRSIYGEAQAAESEVHRRDLAAHAARVTVQVGRNRGSPPRTAPI